jgi:hypothetical protein
MRLLRPAHLRDETWTDLYCAVVYHPSNGQAALALPETEQVPIHLEATGDELAAILATFVADDALTPQEATGIVTAVRANAGQRARVVDFIPPSWSQWVLTQEQANEAGWFSSPVN